MKQLSCGDCSVFAGRLAMAMSEARIDMMLKPVSMAMTFYFSIYICLVPRTRCGPCKAIWPVRFRFVATFEVRRILIINTASPVTARAEGTRWMPSWIK